MLLGMDGNQRRKRNIYDVGIYKRTVYGYPPLDSSCTISLYNINNSRMNEIVYHSLIWIGAGLVVYLAYNL